MRHILILAALTVFLFGCAPPPDQPQSDAVNEKASGSDSSDAGEPEESADATSPEAGQGVSTDDGQLRLPHLTFDIPEQWTKKENNSGFVLAEFVLPRGDKEAEEGRLTVSTAGGSIEANIARWRSQFGNQPSKESQDEVEVGDWQVTIVDYSGEFSDQRGPFSSGPQKQNYRMLAAIFPIDGEQYFVKATGPQKTIEANYEHFQEFVRSARSN